ncbi:hypothetical protein ES703_54784 [subsurface metagenome]
MKRREQGLLSGHGTVESQKKSVDGIMAVLEAFTRPIIGSVGWADSITEEMKDRIRIERLIQIKEADGAKITEATDYEACVYLSTLSLEAPLSRTAQRIYFYLFKKVFPDKSDFLPSYEAKLDIQSRPELKRLKQWLYKTSKTK